MRLVPYRNLLDMSRGRWGSTWKRINWDCRWARTACWRDRRRSGGRSGTMPNISWWDCQQRGGRGSQGGTFFPAHTLHSRRNIDIYGSYYWQSIPQDILLHRFCCNHLHTGVSSCSHRASCFHWRSGSQDNSRHKSWWGYLWIVRLGRKLDTFWWCRWSTCTLKEGSIEHSRNR